MRHPEKYPGVAEHILAMESDELCRFRPRPDSDNDEQASFFESPAALRSGKATFDVVLGGTGSGKTEVAAAKTADFLRRTPAPRKDTPFWVIGETYDMVCSVCWGEKLSKYIPRGIIDGFDWYKTNRDWPFAVMLKDTHNTGTNWVIEFKSYEQGRKKFQAASIGGYWFNEEVPMSIVEEVQGRTREYNSPGWADFTPLEIRTTEWPDRYDNPPDNWNFWHLDTMKNTALAPGWAEAYLSSIPEDMRDTRRYGVFASFRGQVFKEWHARTHVIEPFDIPADWHRMRGIDFGYNNAFCCLWVARDFDGTYYVYDEHFQSQWLIEHHAAEINKREWVGHNHAAYGRTWSDHDAQSRRELSAHGIDTTPARKDVIASIEMIRQFLTKQGNGRPRIYVFSTCKNLIREMRAYHWSETTGKDSRERNAMEAPVPFDDHAVDALRYVIYSEETSTERFSGPIERQPKAWEQGARRFLVRG